jgi:selenocysteine lyase/cysteine desulfurase
MLMAADDAFFARLRADEYPRLDATAAAYLDYAGSALYAESQLRAHQEQLRSQVFGNPHSEHGPSVASTAALDAARDLVLRHFGVSSATHVVCFTANTTAAIKLVAEGFAFSWARSLLLSQDNHNSVNGLREFACRARSAVRYVPLDDDLTLVDPVDALRAHGDQAGLFAFPAQSNFSGVLHPLALVAEARAHGWRVLLDAASFAPTHPLNLSDCEADFVPVSFYKMFGYPGGIGALIARRDALDDLRRPWFSGGTVDYVSVQHQRHQLRQGHEGFEDGTPDFLSALALPAGFALLGRVGQPRLAARVRALTEQFLNGLRGLRHDNGRSAIVVYGPQDACSRGGVVAFNVLDADGHVVPYWEIETAARARGLAMRGGCFCNPGAAEAAFRFDAGRTAACFAELGRDFTIPGFARCLGPGAVVGAVRASFGIPTSAHDIDRALVFLETVAHSSALDIRMK